MCQHINSKTHTLSIQHLFKFATGQWIAQFHHISNITKQISHQTKFTSSAQILAAFYAPITQKNKKSFPPSRSCLIFQPLSPHLPQQKTHRAKFMCVWLWCLSYFPPKTQFKAQWCVSWSSGPEYISRTWYSSCVAIPVRLIFDTTWHCQDGLVLCSVRCKPFFYGRMRVQFKSINNNNSNFSPISFSVFPFCSGKLILFNITGSWRENIGKFTHLEASVPYVCVSLAGTPSCAIWPGTPRVCSSWWRWNKTTGCSARDVKCGVFYKRKTKLEIPVCVLCVLQCDVT